MREIGMIMDSGEINTLEGLDTYSLSWLPNGKQLSYAYKGVTYLVTVAP
jgi:hypothetical protein